MSQDSKGRIVIGMVSDPFLSQVEAIKAMRKRGFRIVSMTDIVSKDMVGSFNGATKILLNEDKRHELSGDMALSESNNVDFKKWFGEEVLSNVPVYCQPNTPATMALMWRGFREKTMASHWIGTMMSEISRTDDDRPVFISEIGDANEVAKLKEMGGKVWLATKNESEFIGWWDSVEADAVIYLDGDISDQIESRVPDFTQQANSATPVMGDCP